MFTISMKTLILFTYFAFVVGLRKYDRPTPAEGTTLDIIVTLSMIDLNSIRVVDMDYRLDYDIKYEWKIANSTCDGYIRKLQQQDLISNDTGPDVIILTGRDATSFWVPDTYVEEVKKIEIPTLPGSNQFLTIYIRNSSCDLKYEVRLAAIVGCQMDFHAYPYDTQVCYFRIRSHFNPLPLVRYQWNASGVTFESDLDLNNYGISYSWNQYNSSRNGVRFSWLEVTFIFQRQLSHFIVQAVAPTMIIVIVAYSSFWIGVDSGPGRFILTVTTFLSLITQFTGLKNQLPPVSYITGLDIWMLGCMLFVFSAIMELAVVNYLDKKRRVTIERKKLENEERKRLLRMAMKPSANINPRPIISLPFPVPRPQTAKEVTFSNGDVNGSLPMQLFHNELNEIINEPDKGIKVDWVVRVLYPVAFLAFNVVYWPLLLTQRLI